jgi:hypothetical protein
VTVQGSHDGRGLATCCIPVIPQDAYFDYLEALEKTRTQAAELSCRKQELAKGVGSLKRKLLAAGADVAELVQSYLPQNKQGSSDLLDVALMRPADLGYNALTKFWSQEHAPVGLLSCLLSCSYSKTSLYNIRFFS